MAPSIRVRMYRVGFGDCFLVSFHAPDNGDPRHVLVDCGVHRKGTLGTEHLQAVVDDIETETRGRLSVVIASHAHEDHVAGFGTCVKSFDEFQIDEVWLPWTDNPNDLEAQKLELGQAALAAQLRQHFDATASEQPSMSPAAREVREAASDAVANIADSNMPAMRALRGGFASQARVRYLRAKDRLSAPAGIVGLHVQVLGPPRDEKFLKRMDPPKAERYLRLVGSQSQEENGLKPFGAWWSRTPAQVALDPALSVWPMPVEERIALKDALTQQLMESLAFVLDQARNNTSLVLLFKYAGKSMLFPGDAQYGNWRFWLDNMNSGEILEELDFLKVAHHASHNASPRSAIESLGKTVTAMVSTHNTPWKSIPRPELMTRLAQVTNERLLRSDSIPVDGAPVVDPPKKLPHGVTRGKFWYDLTITT